MKPQVQFETSSGIRCVSIQTQTSSEICGIVVGVGSRDENPSEEGLAHFIEHTIFTGTKRHRAAYIINCMERTGGEINAYTTKEETAIYSLFPSGNLGKAATLIADLAVNSQFPTPELDLEREVVLDEIASYRDMPSEAVFDDFDEMFYAGNPLAHNILGTQETVRSFTSEQCRRFLSEHYFASNIAFFHVGPTKASAVEKIANKAFRFFPTEGLKIARQKPKPLHPFKKTIDNNGHQAHTVIGGAVGGLDSVNRPALTLTSNILGGPGMNSLLNVALRERRGLVYSVDTSTALYSDTGLLSIYFGCDKEDTARCRRIIDATIRRLAERPMSDRQLEAWKRQITGHISISRDNIESLGLAAGRSLLNMGRVDSFQTISDRIFDVRSEKICEIASLILPSKQSSLTLF